MVGVWGSMARCQTREVVSPALRALQLFPPSVLLKTPPILVMAFAIDPQTTTTLYVGGFDSSTRIGGVFKSTDGGQSWSALNAGLTTSRVWHLAIDPQTPTTLYAGTSMGVFAIQQTTVGGAVTTTVNFDTPAAPGGQ